jgi:hypothetical protein
MQKRAFFIYLKNCGGAIEAQRRSDFSDVKLLIAMASLLNICPDPLPW